MSEVSLAPSPRFLAKNETEAHPLAPMVIPAWFMDGRPHPVCPVHALQAYMDASAQAPPDHLFVTIASLRPCTKNALSKVLGSLIVEAVPEGHPSFKDLRRYGSTLAYLHCFSVESTRLAGQ